MALTEPRRPVHRKKLMKNARWPGKERRGGYKRIHTAPRATPFPEKLVFPLWVPVLLGAERACLSLPRKKKQCPVCGGGTLSYNKKKNSPRSVRRATNQKPQIIHHIVIINPTSCMITKATSLQLATACPLSGNKTDAAVGVRDNLSPTLRTYKSSCEAPGETAFEAAHTFFSTAQQNKTARGYY